MKSILSASFLFLIFSVNIFAQAKSDTTKRKQVFIPDAAVLVNFGYGMHFPQADLKPRFGWNNSAGGQLLYMTSNNWLYGAEGYIHFGNRMKENPITELYTDYGFIIDGYGRAVQPVIEERGFYIGAKVGKLIKVAKHNPRSGIEIGLGAGFMQHKINITGTDNIPVLTGDYLKGYDRLSNGFALQQFIGYRLLSKFKLVNFYIGAEFTEAFTKNRRSWDFQWQKQETGTRIDILTGFRIGWCLPFYIFTDGDGQNVPKKRIYY